MTIKEPLGSKELVPSWLIVIMTLGLMAFSLVLTYALYRLLSVSEEPHQISWCLSNGLGLTTRDGGFWCFDLNASTESWTLLLVIVSSLVTGITHTATSFASFVGNRKLYTSWLPWYILRPTIGMVTAILFFFVYLAFGDHVFQNISNDSTEVYPILALSGLAGLFSKQTSLKLKEVFNYVFHIKEENENLKDSLNNNRNSKAVG